MGISLDSYNQFIESVPANRNLRILELGTQDLAERSAQEALENLLGDSTGSRHNLFSVYLRELGYDVTVIDIMGDRGSIPVNLCEDIAKWDLGLFDIITNYGTTEHVDNQYMCWKNMHESLKVGGILISDIPKVGSWPGHCEYYYDLNFFQAFKEIGYEIIYSKDHLHPDNGALIGVTLKKITDIPFFKNREYFDNLVFRSTDPIQINQYWK